jgi:4-amino-4-deoxy-L-arabinose transferase-like glycosyltransferase
VVTGILETIPPAHIEEPEVIPAKPAAPAHRFAFDKIAIALAFMHWMLAVTASMHKSPTFDEPAHLTGGYSYWLRGDYRLNPENGNLPQRWAALPLLVTQPTFIATDAPSWNRAGEGDTGHEFFYTLGNDSDDMLMRARMMIALFSAGACVLIYFWSKALFGPIGGLLSATLAALSPTMLAHGALVTSDMAAALFFTASVWCVWRLLNFLSWTNVFFATAALSGMAVAKISGPLIIPMIAILIAVRLISRAALHVAVFRDWMETRVFRQALIFAATFTTLFVVVLVVIWASFSFRYSALAETGPYRAQYDAKWNRLLKHHGLVMDGVAFARANHLLPEAYLYGVGVVDRDSHGRPSFLDGEFSIIGFDSFFPKALLYKTTIPVLALLLLALAAIVWRWRAVEQTSAAALLPRIRNDLYQAAPLWTLIAVYGAFAIATELNIGHRHLLPLYPALFVLCGASVVFLKSARRKIIGGLIALLVCWHAAESFAIRPDYLAYFNQLAGGPNHGYQHLVDSSLDWGQDLPALRDWLEQHRQTIANRPVYLSYFGTADPKTYEIDAIRLPQGAQIGTDTHDLTGGIYCISATSLQQVYAKAMGTWCEPYERQYRAAGHELQRLHQMIADGTPASSSFGGRSAEAWARRIAEFHQIQLARLCAALRHQKPVADAGHSILIFDVSDQAVKQAIYGPPAELLPASQVIGVDRARSENLDQ